jgi:hypothetical protein
VDEENAFADIGGRLYRVGRRELQRGVTRAIMIDDDGSLVYWILAAVALAFTAGCSGPPRRRSPRERALPLAEANPDRTAAVVLARSALGIFISVDGKGRLGAICDRGSQPGLTEIRRNRTAAQPPQRGRTRRRSRRCASQPTDR